VLRERRARLKSLTKKPKRPKREDAAQSAFRALQQVIETTEGKKPALTRKPRYLHPT
jgi:hypothetical protein